MPALVSTRRTTPPRASPKSWMASPSYGVGGRRTRSVSMPVILICFLASAANAKPRLSGAAAVIANRFRLVIAHSLEYKAQGEFDLARLVGLPVVQEQLAEVGRGRRQGWVAAKQRMVQNIEGIGAELQIQSFLDLRALYHSQIEIGSPAVPQVAEI